MPSMTLETETTASEAVDPGKLLVLVQFEEASIDSRLTEYERDYERIPGTSVYAFEKTLLLDGKYLAWGIKAEPQAIVALNLVAIPAEFAGKLFELDGAIALVAERLPATEEGFWTVVCIGQDAEQVSEDEIRESIAIYAKEAAADADLIEALGV